MLRVPALRHSANRPRAQCRARTRNIKRTAASLVKRTLNRPLGDTGKDALWPPTGIAFPVTYGLEALLSWTRTTSEATHHRGLGQACVARARRHAGTEDDASSPSRPDAVRLSATGRGCESLGRSPR
jgi:hypothetical protein